MLTALFDDDGNVWAISLAGEPFAQEIVVTRTVLECANDRFLQHGDGLIVINAIEGVATYGEVGPAEDHHGPAVRARLLQVRPGRIDQYIDHVLGPIEGES